VWTALRSCSTAQHVVSAPVLDIAAYCGYMFVLVSAASCVKILFPGAYAAKIAAIGWGATAGAVFIVKARSMSLTLVPIRPRWRCELHSLRTFSPVRPSFLFRSAQQPLGFDPDVPRVAFRLRF
jgi:hypothetical protein